MTDTDTGGVQNDGVSADVDRRRVLKAAGASMTAVAAFSGTASAHDVETVAFCGCSQVTVYGVLLCDGAPDPCDGGYEAVVYCDGEVLRRPLFGTNDRQNYDVHEDEAVGDDCQLIAVEGTTWTGDQTQEFTICNEHCPARCAERGLADTGLSCDDPDSVGSKRFGTLSVQCSGCGREEPG